MRLYITLCLGFWLALSWVVAFVFIFTGHYIYEPNTIIISLETTLAVLATGWFVYMVFQTKEKEQ